MYIIYKLTCKTTGESYIGQTSNLKQRLEHHKLPSSDCPRIRNAIQKYGWDDFIVTILKEDLTADDANHFEEVLIEEHNTLSPFGYNLQTGGDHRILSEESKRKISQTLSGRSRSEKTKSKCSASHVGKKLSEEHKEKIRQTRLRGVMRSEETKAKISASQKGKPGRPGCGDIFKSLNEQRKGQPLSEEHKQKIREARIGKPKSEETKAKIRASLLARKQKDATTREKSDQDLHPDTGLITDQLPSVCFASKEQT